MVHGPRLVVACATLSAATCVASCAPQGVGGCDAGSTAAPIECPGLFMLLVAPAKVDVGSSATLTATSPAGTEGGATVLSWSAPSGKFSDPSSAQTMFQCTLAGNVTLTLTLTQAGCSETLRAQVECLGPGDGGAGG